MRKEKNENFIAAVISLFITFGLFWIFCTSYIGPGYTGVCINILAQDDVQESVLGTGLHVLAPWKKVWTFPIFEQNVSWEHGDSFKFQTAEGLASDADIGITFAVDVEKVPMLFKKYRSGIDEISQKFVKNYLRDAITLAASSRGIEELYGRGKEKFLFDVETVVRDKLNPLGIIVSRVYLVDAFEFPPAVVRALNQKIEAAQRAEQRENELRESEAQAKKDVAAARGLSDAIVLRAKAEAESNALVTQSLSHELLMYEAIKSWDGKLPETLAGDIIQLLKSK